MADRNTPWKDGQYLSLPLAAGVLAEGGRLAARNNEGYLVPAADAANYKVVGVFWDTVDNQDGQNGEAFVLVHRNKLFLFENSSTNPVTLAHVGEDVYVEDEQTVSASPGTNSIVAGVCMGIEPDGVWVEC